MNSSTGTGATLCELTFIVFLVLKLCNVITWSWWWVTAPLWIPIGLLIIGLLVWGIVYGIKCIIEHRKEKRKFYKR